MLSDLSVRSRMPSSHRLLVYSKSGDAMFPVRERGKSVSKCGTPRDTSNASITLRKLRSCSSSLKFTTILIRSSHSPAASISSRLKNYARMAAVCLVLVNLADSRDCMWQMSLVKLRVPSSREMASRESSLVCCCQREGRRQLESRLTSRLTANFPIFCEECSSSISTDTTGDNSLLPTV